MAVVGKNGLGKFFIYDHNKLKKEEDDLKDAIIYFYPVFFDADEQCALCGQLMGMSEFLKTTISESVPTIFKLQNEKYCLKRIGDYSLGLEGSLNESDFNLKEQLAFLYQTFIMFCGSFQNIYQQFEGNYHRFVNELQKIWKILYPSASYYNNFISQVFQILPTVHLPKSGSDLFCQASDILQTSQRRPGVLVGAVLYKSKVLCSQMPPELTRKLVLVKPEMPCLNLKTDYEISRTIRMITVYLTMEEMAAIDKTFKPLSRHTHPSQFVWHDQSDQMTSSVLSEITPTMNLIWTAHDDNSESLEVESLKISINRKQDYIETISDLEENGNGCQSKSSVDTREHIVDISEGLAILKNQKTQNELGLERKPKYPHQTVEVVVHHSTSDTDSSIPDEHSSGRTNQNEVPDGINSAYNNSSSDIPTEKLSSNNAETDSDNTLKVRVSGLKDIDDSIHKSHIKNKHDDSSVEVTSRPNSNDLKVDCLHECSCDCENVKDDISAKKSFVKTGENVQNISAHDKNYKHGLNRTVKNKTSKNDTEKPVNSIANISVDNGRSTPDIYLPEWKIDEISVQMEPSTTDLTDDYSHKQTDRVSEESESVGETEGSLSDIASLSTSRRKERFDFHSSADESSSEYSLLSKRHSFESFYGGKSPKILQSEAGKSNSTSLQNTLIGSETISLQSSHSGLLSHSSMSEKNTKQYWIPRQDNLYEMTLYVQGQSSSQSSDISLMLLLDKHVVEDKSVLHSLWKDALPQLADLDFYVKESVEQQLDEGFMESSSYLKYDSFFHRIEGNETDIPVNEDFQKLAAEIHKDYHEFTDFTSIALTSHLCSCNSSKDTTNEVYIHVDGTSSNR